MFIFGNISPACATSGHLLRLDAEQLGLPTLDLGISGLRPDFPSSSLPSLLSPSPPSFPFPGGPPPKPAGGLGAL